MEAELKNEEILQRVEDIAFECARKAVLDDCETELEILGGSIIHYADLYCVDAGKLLQSVIQDIL